MLVVRGGMRRESRSFLRKVDCFNTWFLTPKSYPNPCSSYEGRGVRRDSELLYLIFFSYTSTNFFFMNSNFRGNDALNTIVSHTWKRVTGTISPTFFFGTFFFFLLFFATLIFPIRALINTHAFRTKPDNISTGTTPKPPLLQNNHRTITSPTSTLYILCLSLDSTVLIDVRLFVHTHICTYI